MDEESKGTQGQRKRSRQLCTELKEKLDKKNEEIKKEKRMIQKNKEEEGISTYEEEKDIVVEFNQNWRRSSKERHCKHVWH